MEDFSIGTSDVISEAVKNTLFGRLGFVSIEKEAKCQQREI